MIRLNRIRALHMARPDARNNKHHTRCHHTLTARSDWTGFYLILLNFVVASSMLCIVIPCVCSETKAFFRRIIISFNGIGAGETEPSWKIILCNVCFATKMCVSNYRAENAETGFLSHSQLCLSAFYFFALVYSISFRLHNFRWTDWSISGKKACDAFISFWDCMANESIRL